MMHNIISKFPTFKEIKNFIMTHMPSYPLVMAFVFTILALDFYLLKFYGACWLFLIFSAIFVATDCICNAIRSIGK